MIPILYESDELAFSSNGLGRLRDIIECTVTEGRNEVYECDFSYPVNGRNYDEIQLERIILVEHDDTGETEPFDIKSKSEPINGVVTFHCTHVSYRLRGVTVSGTNINSLSGAFTALSGGHPSNPFTYGTDKSSTGYVGAFDGVPRSVRSILGGVEGSILDAYGGEYEFNRWNVYLHENRGQIRDFSVRYGVNLIDYNNDTDYSDTYTAVIPFWQTEGTVVKGGLITSGQYTPSGREICVPLDLSDKFETQPTVAQVESMARSVLASKQPWLPAQNITVNFIRLQDTPEYAHLAPLLDCRLCDRIKVIMPMYGTEGYFKIVKVVWDVLQERYLEMELGTLSTSLAEALGIESDSTDRPAPSIYSDSASQTIDAADIDTFTSGASVTLPKGKAYAIIAQWTFNSRSTTGVTNSEVQIYDGSNAVARNRINAAGQNWNVMQAFYITDVLTADTTFTVRASSSRTYTSAQPNYIRAYPL